MRCENMKMDLGVPHTQGISHQLKIQLLMGSPTLWN